MYCAIVVPYRVRIVIPASEMWESGNERPDYVLQNMVGASIDLVIIKVEREAGFAIGSRRLASRSQRYFFAHREDLHRIGSRVKCRMLAVGPRRCLVDCYGHDLDLTQREMRYAAIPDLRDEYHPGMELESVVKVYDSTKDELIISVKETETNPILGAEQRHPVGSRRLAVISGKYGGGVFCNLPDGVVCMCNYSFQHEDSDFMVGENVMLVVQRYNEEKLQMFGKILSKWYHLQSFNYQPRARRQKYMQVHTKNKKRKEFLKEVYPFETYEIPQNPNELEYRIENSREQKIKEYDFFISHSSKDGTIVQKLIRAENQNGKNIFCDWINDVDYLKRHLLCEATLKVLEKRMEQSKAMIFVVSENSRNSVWCKYELNYFTELGKPIYCISKEAIDEKNFHLNKMSDTWFLDSDYKRLALIEGESINV